MNKAKLRHFFLTLGLPITLGLLVPRLLVEEEYIAMVFVIVALGINILIVGDIRRDR